MDLIDVAASWLVIIVTIIGIIAVIWFAWRFIKARLKKASLKEIRGMISEQIKFNKLPTVPTVRITMIKGVANLEIGKRAKLRTNSLHDPDDKKTWEIRSPPTQIKAGADVEMGYITHPSGITLALVPNVKVIRADPNGYEMVKGAPMRDENGSIIIEEGVPGGIKLYKETVYEHDLNFEGTLGKMTGLDDFNESIDYEKQGNWFMPFLIGIIAGVIFIAPLFAWLMAKAGGH